ncbi:uncharacterized protein LOC120653432 [Panicum virgatum]|uniref:uncharacterized protein LOC120653432 n=1 Tax=Panicum virgatum TaxID=38727 RepID=UPI0019D5C4F2|nr:uncharacterized protein LOC120653432 [Panicum virgatum]
MGDADIGGSSQRDAGHSRQLRPKEQKKAAADDIFEEESEGGSSSDNDVEDETFRIEPRHEKGVAQQSSSEEEEAAGGNDEDDEESNESEGVELNMSFPIIQKPVRLGFGKCIDYSEEMSVEEAHLRVKRVLLDVDAVPKILLPLPSVTPNPENSKLSVEEQAIVDDTTGSQPAVAVDPSSEDIQDFDPQSLPEAIPMSPVASQGTMSGLIEPLSAPKSEKPAEVAVITTGGEEAARTEIPPSGQEPPAIHSVEETAPTKDAPRASTDTTQQQSDAAEATPGNLLVLSPKCQYPIKTELLDDPSVSNVTLKDFQRTFKDMYKYIMTMANRSREKSDVLKTVEEGSHQLLAKDEKIRKKIFEHVELHNELDKLKAERTREVWLLNQEIINLTKDNCQLGERLKAANKAHRDDVELLEKTLQDADKQMVENTKQIKSMAEEKQLRDKQFEELEAAARAVVDMVDPAEEGIADDRSLLEQLREAPQKITSYVSEVTNTYVAHVLGLFKSFWPLADLNRLSAGMALDYNEEKFEEYVEQSKPLAQKIIDNLDQE